MDDRRRRKLIVHQDHSAEAESAGIHLARRPNVGSEDQAETWPLIPARTWVLGLELFATLLAIAFITATELTISLWPDEWGLWGRLFVGPNTSLYSTMLTGLVSASAIASIAIGWFRSKSPEDYHGRYRIWTVAAGAFGLAAFLMMTRIGPHFAGLIQERLNWWTWRPEVSLPAALCLGLLSPIAIMIDRDLRGSRVAATLWRFSLFCGFAILAESVFRSELRTEIYLPYVPVGLLSAMLGFAWTGLRWNMHFVAYVNANPPIRAAKKKTRGSWLTGLFTPLPVEGLAEKTAPKRRRKKVTEDGEETAGEEEAKPTRKRTTRASKPKRPTRSRTKTQEQEEDTSQESNDYGSEDSSYAESSETSTAGNGSVAVEEDWEALERLTNPEAYADAKRNKNRSVPKPHFESPSVSPNRQDEEETGTAEDQWNEELELGLDPEELAGLSKKQRKELKRKAREQQRLQGR